jgi:hypothetical protein
MGLKTDLVRKVGLKESEIFYHTGYDIEAEYKAVMAGGLPDEPDFGLTVYDTLYPDCSPKGKNTLNIIATQGFDYWKKFETDYFHGNKDAYTKEKMRLDVPGRGVRRLRPQRPRLLQPGDDCYSPNRSRPGFMIPLFERLDGARLFMLIVE